MHPQFFEVYWDDADADEILKLEGQVPVVAFVERIEVWVKESDFFQGPAAKTQILALTDTDPLVKAVQQSFDVESGTYRFECTLTRSPQ